MVAHALLKVTLGDDETGNIEWALYLDCHDVGGAPLHTSMQESRGRNQHLNSCHTDTSTMQ
jgi:hypothetical protein